MTDFNFTYADVNPRLSRRVKKEIANRSAEIFPLGLYPFASADAIHKKTTEIDRDMKYLAEINGYDIAELWSYFCKQINTKSVLPAPHKLKTRIRKLLFNAVEKASFVYQSITGHAGDYISDEYYNYLKSIKGFYTGYLYSHSQDKKKHARASNYLARACGIASLAKKDGMLTFFLSITMKPEYHRSSPEWNGNTDEQSAKLITDAIADFTDHLKNNRVNAEFVRMIEPDKKGTPHFQGTVFTDDPEKFREQLERVFINEHKITDPGKYGIYFEETDNAYRSILYTLKTAWPGNDRIDAWKKGVRVRCFGISSNVRSLPNVATWEAERKGKYTAKVEVEALKRLESKLNITHYDDVSGESLTCLGGEYYTDRDDAIADTHAKLQAAADEGDYADFTRIHNSRIGHRKPLTPLTKRYGLETAGSLGSREIKAITELRTIRQVIRLFGDKIRDIEDHKWLLRNKWIGKKSPARVKAEKKRDKFLKGFADYIKFPRQPELNLTFT